MAGTARFRPSLFVQQATDCYNITDMNEHERRALCQAALAARERAYCPYSHFAVGAAILAEDGRIYTGANVENASYGAAICAERSAATAAVSAGARRFLGVAIAGWPQGAVAGPSDLAYPCGICRQFLNEFAGPEMPIWICRGDDDVVESSLGALLPEAFGPQNLL